MIAPLKAHKLIDRFSDVSFAIAFVVLVGWVFHLAPVKSVIPGFATMKANTAIAFLGLATAIRIFHLREKRKALTYVALACLAVVVFIAVGTLAEYAFHQSFGIDEFLFADPEGITGNFPPGRPAPITALNFLMLAMAIALTENPWRRRVGLAQLFGFAVFLLTLQAFVSLIFGVHSTFGLAFYTRMAIHTTALFLLLTTATLFLSADRGFVAVIISRTSAGMMSRRMIAAAVLLSPLVNWIAAFAENAKWIDADTAVLFRVTGTAAFLTLIIYQTARELFKTEQDLNDFRSRCDAVLRSSDVILFSLDSRGVFNFSEGNGLRRIGVEPGSRVGKSVYDIYADAPDVLAAIDRAKKGEMTKLRVKIGDAWIECVYSPAKDRRGNPVGVVGVGMDVTERVQLEETHSAKIQLQLERDRAEASTRAKSMFLANMSHEIRTPIHGIMGVNWLLRETPLSEEQRKLAETMQGSSENLLRIVNDILDFSKIEAGELTIEVREFSLGSLIARARDSVALAAKNKGITLRVEQASALGDARRGDEGRMLQVLTNFLSNAVKFTSAGHVELRVRPVDGADPNLVRFEVFDTGIGIPPDAQARVFEAFAQADISTTRKYGGTGLGLSISKSLVERMGGRIGFDSEVGHGSRFWCELPLVAGTATVVASHGAGSLDVSGKRELRILVAEDNAVNQLVIRKMLTHLGHVPTIVGNGLLALEALGRQPFDLVLMDCQMPEMDGYAATAEIRGNAVARIREIPIVALTADAVEGNRERCLAAGMTEYLSKPVRPEGLSAMIQRLAIPANDQIA